MVITVPVCKLVQILSLLLVVSHCFMYRFTSSESLDAAHRLRRDLDAVLVGVETVVRDNPSLTVRR